MKICIDERMSVIAQKLDMVLMCKHIYEITVENDNGENKTKSISYTLYDDDANNFAGCFSKTKHNFSYNSYKEFEDAGWANEKINEAVLALKNELGIE